MTYCTWFECSIAACVLSLVAIGCDPPNPIDACQYATIQAAIDDAPEGWRVSICNGVHNEAITLRKSIALTGASRDGVVLTGRGGGTILSIDDVHGAVVVQRLTLRPAAGASATRTGVHAQNSDDVQLADTSVDFRDVVAPTPAEMFTGVDVETAKMAVKHSTIKFFSPKDLVSIGVRVRGISKADLGQVEVDDAGDVGVQSSDADTHLDGITISGSGADGVHVLSGDVHLSNSTIDSVARDGLLVTGGTLTAEGVTIKSTSGFRFGALAGGGSMVLNQTTIEGAIEGIQATLGQVVATECTIDNSLDVGLHVRAPSGLISFDKGTVSSGNIGVLLEYPDAYISLTDAIIKDTAGRGIVVHDGQFAMTGGTVQTTGGEGVWADGGSLLLDNMTVMDCKADGVVLTGKAEATLADVTVKNNAGWGVICDDGGPQADVQLLTCTGHFYGNINGQTNLINGCELLYSCQNLGP